MVKYQRYKSIKEVTGIEVTPISRITRKSKNKTIIPEEHYQIVFIMHELENKKIEAIAYFIKKPMSKVIEIMNTEVYKLMKERGWLPAYLCNTMMKEPQVNYVTDECIADVERALNSYEKSSRNVDDE